MRIVIAAVIFSVIAIGATAAEAPSARTSHGHNYVAPPPSSIQGQFSLRTLDGQPYGSQSLRGSWSLVYFGYSRCRSACPIGLMNLATAVTELRRGGINPKAIFIDVEEPPPAAPRLRRTSGETDPRSKGRHDDHLDPRMRALHEAAEAAARDVANRFRDQVTVLTGTRAELRAAVLAFRVRREHVPVRDGEQGHSINHTTTIYVMDPEGRVRGYLYHDASPDEMVRMIRSFSARGR